jgi:hypothetical protein
VLGTGVRTLAIRQHAGAPKYPAAVAPGSDRSAPAVCVVSASGQNVFFAELLGALADELSAAGLRVEHSVDRFPPWRDDLVYLFVPHEYAPLVDEKAHPHPGHLRRSVVLCTEQPGTTWFERVAAMAGEAGAALDINPVGTRELRGRGIAAGTMRLGYYGPWDTWRGEPGERPIDVLFMGGYTTRRARALARCAHLLLDRRVELILTDSSRPHLADSSSFLSGEDRWSVLQRSKLIVNVHRGTLAYLEWLRVVGAILNGCVVVTEHSVGFAPLVPGEHFVSVAYERLPHAIEALLAEPARIDAIRASAYEFLRSKVRLADTIAPLVRALERTSAAPIEPGQIPPPMARAPVQPKLPQTEYERIFELRGDLDRVKAGVKGLVLGQLALTRRLARIESGSSGESRSDAVERRGPPSGEPRVSVLLTVYNYADVVADAVRSVAESNYEDRELIVVDDCSRDESGQAVRAELDRHASLPATIVTRAENLGLAAARNCAVEHARGEYVFILDADNVVYPHAFARLVEALDAAPETTFAYGILEQFGPDGPVDLLSWHRWDADRLRYGNYIDAMAMIRRAAVLEVGGYTSDARLYGWEDFALWCAFADRGWNGVLVPEILARYRKGVGSMISTTDIDASAAWGALVETYPFLTASNLAAGHAPGPGDAGR